jgi:streptogramin lyase
MQRCAFCGSEFPDNARFCGQCGRAPVATLDAPTTLSSAQARPVPKKEAEEEEERRRRAFLLDLPFSPGGGSQPVAGQVPVVQGTPQMSGVPVVQGTPQMSGAPAASAVSSSAAPPAPSLSGPPPAPQSGAPMAPPAAPAKPVPVGSPHPPQELPHHERQGQQLSGKLHVPRSGGSAPARVLGSAHKGLLIALAGLMLIAAGGITLALIHKSGGGTPPRPGTITSFSLPTAASHPEAITAGPDGNLWFTEFFGNKIGRITPGGTITEFPLAASSGPSGIIAGPDGNLWFTEYSGGKIGRITPGGTITEFPLPDAAGGPRGITAGPDGNLWFTEDGGNQIGRITPNGTITEFPLPPVVHPYGIAAGPDGNLWFTEFDGEKIGRIGAG